MKSKSIFIEIVKFDNFFFYYMEFGIFNVI